MKGGLRKLHRWIGVGTAAFGLMLALTGVVLAIDPIREAATTGALVSDKSVDVAALSQTIFDQIKGVERIEKTANNSVIVHFSTLDGFGRVHFDPATNAPLADVSDTPVMGFVKELHRSLFLRDTGRAVSGITAFSMLVLTLTGLAIIIKRMGGWRALLQTPTSGTIQRWHLRAGRIAAIGLLIVSTSGVFLSLTSFDIIPSQSHNMSDRPMVDVTSDPLLISDFSALQAVNFAEFRELTFPYPDDLADVFQLQTSTGNGYINPYTGQLAEFQANGTWARIYELMYLLHTGQGAWGVGVLLGISMLVVPVLIISGLVMAYRRPRNPLKGIKRVSAKQADTVILVGSEGGSTWGFAAELARKLHAAGKAVHVADLNALADSYPNGKNLFILTSTYGAGAAPSNAQSALDHMCRFNANDMKYTVLGFGDKTFPEFCKFASDVDTALTACGLHSFCPLKKIDRQSAQSFADWGKKIGVTLGCNLDLVHSPNEPRTKQVRLSFKQVYGQEVQAPVAILRFETARFKRIPRHAAGDLLGVITENNATPRYYSLASNSDDGIIEVCVRKQPGGLCSGYLTSLEIGGAIDVFIVPNPIFKVAKSEAPLILIGAGAGLAPLMGFLRENKSKRPTHLFWGGRDPKSDYLYREELVNLKETGNLSKLTTNFSRVEGGGYVQSKLQEKNDEMRHLIAQGAQVLVCGGRTMGDDVRTCFDAILRPSGISVDQLMQQQRYVEDVY